MSAFNSHPLWFLFCSAQGEADSANLSLLRRWRYESVPKIRQTGKLPHTAYKQAESELAEAYSLQNKVGIVPGRIHVRTRCPACQSSDRFYIFYRYIVAAYFFFEAH